MTLISSISERRGIVHTSIFNGSNNQETFKKFICDLKAKCLGRRCLVVMDNLSVHKSRIVLEVFSP